jgi:phage baseplate assembly protein gpV
MSTPFIEFFDPPREVEHDRNRHYGIFPAIVTNNVDPDGMYRVKVRFPHLPGENESFWARVVTPMAGKDRGWFFLPEVNDEVLVMFEHGDVHHPIVVGQIWNGRDIPPHDNADGKNNLRFFRSRNGHRVILDDTKDAEKIVIAEKTGKNRIVIDSVKNTIQVLSEDGDITLNAPKGLLKVDATSFLVHATDSLKLTAGGEMTTKIGGTSSVTAGPSMDVKSGRTEFNPSSGSGGGGESGKTLDGDDTISKMNLAKQNEAQTSSAPAEEKKEEKKKDSFKVSVTDNFSGVDLDSVKITAGGSDVTSKVKKELGGDGQKLSLDFEFDEGEVAANADVRVEATLPDGTKIAKTWKYKP